MRRNLFRLVEEQDYLAEKNKNSINKEKVPDKEQDSAENKVDKSDVLRWHIQ